MGSTGAIVLVLGLLLETIGVVPVVKAVIKVPIPMTISGPVGGVMIALGVILISMGI